MPEQSEIEKLQLSIESLKTEIKCLTISYEDALNHRVYDNTKKILVFIVFWLTIITAGLAFLGFNAYRVIIDKGPSIVTEIMEQQVKNLVIEHMKNFSLDIQTTVESEASQLIKTAQNKLGINLTEILKKQFCKGLEEKHISKQKPKN